MRSVLYRACKLALAAALWFTVPALAQPEVDALRVYLGTTGATCTLHSGSGAPSTSLGSVCDVYTRTDSPYTTYVKTGGSTWTSITAPGYTTGDLFVASSASAMSRIAAVGVGQVLVSSGTSTLPAWSATPSVTTLTAATSVGSPLFTHSAASQITTASGNLTLAPAGDIIFNPTGNDLLPTTGYDLNIGALTNKFQTLHVAELWAETLVAQDTIATIGGRVLVGPTTTLTADLASGATTMQVKHNQIVSGDRVVLQVAGSIEWIAVTSNASGSPGAYTYSIARNQDGSGANNWTAGDAVFNTGTTGDGYIDLYSVNGVIPGSTAGPTIVGNRRNSGTYNDVSSRWAIGNLNGLYGYGTDTYGAAFGDFTNSYITIDETNGIRMIGDSGTMFSMTAAGDATFAGRLTVGTGRNILANTEFLRGRGAGDSYSGFWGGSASTGDLSAPYTCATACGQRAVHGSGWSWLGADEDTAAAGLVIGADSAAANRPLGSGAIYFYPSSGTPANGTYGRIAGPVIPIDEDLRYEYSAYIGMNGGTWSTRARVLWYGADGGDAGDQPDYISEVDGSTVCTTGTQGPDLGTWCRIGGIFTPPAGARLAILAVIAIYDGGDATPITFVTKPFFAQATTGQTTLTPWGPGGQTLITGDMLSTDLVVSNTLRSSGATALATGTGYWLDASSTPTFRVGNPAGNRLSWDGTNLELVSANASINSTGVAVTPGTVFDAGRAYGFTTTTGTLGVYAADPDGAGRRLQLRSTWTGTGNYALGPAMISELVAGNEPTSGGTVKTAYIRAIADTTSGVQTFTLLDSDYTQFGTDLRISQVNATATTIPYMRSDGNYLVIESRSTANGGTIYLGLDNNTNINTGLGGGTTVINTALMLNGLVSCTLQVNGSGFVGCVSDQAAKKDIETWKPGLDVISKLRPVSYRWQDGDTDKHIGFIAQEVDAVIPDAVRPQSWGGGLLTLDDRAILAALVNAVQELQRKSK